MALFVDITERKNLEKTLVQQSEKLKELNSAKDKFLSIIAHDLKSPFNSLIGFSDLLNTEYEKLEEHQRKLFIKSIRESVNSIYDLLENLLEWSRIQRESIVITPTALGLRELVIKSIDPYIANSNKKEQKVINQIPDNICITADFHSMRTVIGNLFANSVKYTPTGGLIEFSAKQTDSDIVLKIKDTGVGMSTEKTEKLFKIEESVSTPGTSNETGTGLGLIICREYIEKNNCQIGVKSEPGKGTTISILFPKSESGKCK
jgi:signal transduction histidine kinase